MQDAGCKMQVTKSCKYPCLDAGCKKQKNAGYSVPCINILRTFNYLSFASCILSRYKLSPSDTCIAWLFHLSWLSISFILLRPTTYLPVIYILLNLICAPPIKEKSPFLNASEPFCRKFLSWLVNILNAGPACR